MKRIRVAVWVSAVLGTAAIAQEIGYVERFSLAQDREAALQELVPGTDDDYFYRALHAQNSGERDRFKEIMARWQRDRDGELVRPARELRDRQALLDYEREPQATLDYLRRELGLNFAHARRTEKRVSRAPSHFDNAALAPDALREHALRDPRSLEDLSDEGLAFVAAAKLTDDQRRSLLARLRRPDLPNLVDLVAADLAARGSRGFGHHPVHAQMTLSQLDDLLRRMPRLRNEQAFALAYLAALVPADEVDLDTDAAARQAYFERLWAYASTLEPAHNSLKVNVLYNRLRHDLTQGVFDRARFLEYLKLPRQVSTLRPEFLERVPHANQIARLDQDFKLIALPPVPQEEPLVRRFLLEFFKQDKDYRAFETYLRDDVLKPLFAEAKIVNGIGEPQQWVPLLTPAAYARLKERVDIDFAETNPLEFSTDAPVRLAAALKNVPTLLVKIYEINTFNYYRETGRPLNLAINLDGLVASVSRRIEYAEPAERRHTQTFEFPEIQKRGVYVVELIGNGKSSRALVQKGRLDVLQEVTAAGHAFTVFDEIGKRVTDASGWLGGRAFAAAKDGRIIVPFSTAPGTEHLIVRHGDFATRVAFDHLAERYELSAGIYVEREALIRRERAQIAVRPNLRLNGQPVSVKLLKEVRLTVQAIDLQGLVTTKEFPALTLREDAETVQEILVPEQTVALDVTLHAEIQNISVNQKQKLSHTAHFALNEMERTPLTRALYFGRDVDGHYADLRGKNGEPLAGEPIHLQLRHRYFQSDTISAHLKTDKNGRVRLGALDGVRSLSITSSDGVSGSWQPLHDVCTLPEALHGRAGDTLRVALPPGADPAATLLETRRGRFVKEWNAALAVKDGFLELRGLPAGDYSLWLAEPAREIAVRMTQGESRDGFVVGSRRALELPRLKPLAVTAVTPGKQTIEIRLANVTPFVRVHVVATRYQPAYDLFARLGATAAARPLCQPWQSARAFYESGRDIGDEYRYILDRQQARTFPGNMLERPGLLLNPWALRTTDSDKERLKAGGAYAGRAAREAKADGRGAAVPAERGGAGTTEGFASLDFLRQPAVTLLNLVPDKSGTLSIPREALKGLPCLRVLAVDPTATVLACAYLEDTPVETRDLRLADGLEPAKPFAEQKLITPLQAGETVAVADLAAARFKVFGTVADLYRLLATLNPDPTFAEFDFVAKWDKLDEAEQRRLYSKYACHELHLFLYHKDPRFYEAVVAPALANKKDKTFIDHWLLGDDLSGFLEPWRFGRLNAAERALLGKRLRAKALSLARDARERADLTPPDMEAFNRRFDTAIQAGALEDEATATEILARENAQDPFDTAPSKPKSAGAPQALRAARQEAAPAPSAAFDQVMTVKSPVILKNMYASARDTGTRQAKKRDESVSGLEDKDDIPVFLEELSAERDQGRRFFQKLDKTQEWAENNYWHQPIERQIATLVADNGFWADYAMHDGRTPFLSKALLETTSSFTEMMLALAVLQVPFEAGAHTEQVEGASYTLKAASPLLLFHREIRESARAKEADSVLVAQRFFRADDRARFENEKKFDKWVTDEFLPQVVYGTHVVLTNPTGEPQALNALLQIPVGSIPVNAGFTSKGVYLVLEPYATQTLEYFFTFPATGRFAHYPVTLAKEGRVIGAAEPFTFNVVERLSRADTESWAWLSQNGTAEQVYAFLDKANIHRLDLNEIAWRMKDKAFFKTVISLLEARHIYHDTLWSYGILHNEPTVIRPFLQHSSFATRCGLWLESPLLSLNPVERFVYQHLEYAPLVNPRAHQVGAQRTILNPAFLRQYQHFMTVLRYKPRLSAADTLAVAYYMALQDRVAEALETFGRVKRDEITEKLQYDYLAAYLAFYTGDLERARALAKAHANEGVARWRDRFAQVLAQLDEIAGSGSGATPVNAESRDQAQGALAATEPTLELLVEAGRIQLDTRNVAEVTLNFYPMDIELLFSRNPFLQEGAAQFAFIRPVASRTVAVAAGQKRTTAELPPEFATKNVMVEALAGGVRKTQAYYANTLRVQMIESYGQLVVTQAETGKPVPGAYVKVYARVSGGAVNFIKDGYTDLRGRFDYVSLNTDEANQAERLAVLVMSDAFGAVVRETQPPKR
ncbi:MAG: hypothetical protein KBI41_03400 [Kiritimatiellae bacterium]|nr:hypothetical protein [Kiritimatiellia bacterium]